MSVVLKNFNNEKHIYTFQCHFHNSLSTVSIVIPGTGQPFQLLVIEVKI